MLRPKNNKTKPRIKHRPFLKWAGGKFRLTDDLNRVFPKRKQCLIEPFVGAGAVFLNSHFERYILADINPDLINLFKQSNSVSKLSLSSFLYLSCDPEVECP